MTDDGTFLGQHDWDKLRKADVVFACWGGGESLIVKGEWTLKGIVDTGKSRDGEMMFEPVESADEARALHDRLDRAH